MKSVKPGRGPSMMGGVASVFAVVFGIIWMGGAASMGAPGFFLLFGVAFIGIGVVNAVYSFKNAAGENRYSAYDIVDSDEEPDPLDERFGRQPDNAVPPQAGETGKLAYCPYCGAKLGARYGFHHEYADCENCGTVNANTNAAGNILDRRNDKKIMLYTPYRRVKRICDRRAEPLNAAVDTAGLW